jgi:hypothetical protein
MGDVVSIGIIVVGGPLLALAFFTWVLHYFVGLSSPPTKRSAWTVGIAYLIVTAACIFSFSAGYWWQALLAPVPGALIAFWWWRNDFRRGWIDDSQSMPDGVELATDDWRIGLLELLIFLTVVAAALAMRFFLRSM